MTGCDRDVTLEARRQALKQRFSGISLSVYAGGKDIAATAQVVAGWGCSIAHFDIMDGRFVPHKIGVPRDVEAVAGKLLCDVHLLAENPLPLVGDCARSGADIITVQAETPNALAALNAIREAETRMDRPVLSGVCLLPETRLEDIPALVAFEPDYWLVAAVDPRTGAPPDVARGCKRAGELANHAEFAGALIGLDGGVTLDNIDAIAASATDVVVTGSAVFKADVPATVYGAITAAVAR